MTPDERALLESEVPNGAGLTDEALALAYWKILWEGVSAEEFVLHFYKAEVHAMMAERGMSLGEAVLYVWDTFKMQYA